MKCVICDKPPVEHDQWLAEHAVHGSPVRSYPKNQPPTGTYKIFHDTCPCGSVLVGIEGGSIGTEV